jgi:hypothetical protein
MSLPGGRSSPASKLSLNAVVGGFDPQDHPRFYDLSTGRNVLLSRALAPPPTALTWVARRRGKKRESFKYKKGKPPKPLKLLDPKRQLRAFNRHDRSVYRQKLLALLTVNCHTSVYLLTELEIKNDG